MMTDTLIVDQSETNRFFVMIPYLIDDMGLSVYAVRLYLRIVRRVGNNGSCWENTRNLAAACKMSIGQVSKAKRELEESRLITVNLKDKSHGQFPYHEITIRNIWKQNIEKYTACSPHEQEPVHQMNITCSPGEPKYIPVKGSAKNKKTDAAASAEPITVENSSEFSPSASKHDDDTKRDENIQILKKVTGYYPPKKLRPKIIKLFNAKLGDVLLDESILEDVYTNWIAKGYNPMNYTGLLQHYFERDHYMFDQDKFTSMMPKEQEMQF